MLKNSCQLMEDRVAGVDVGMKVVGGLESFKYYSSYRKFAEKIRKRWFEEGFGG